MMAYLKSAIAAGAIALFAIANADARPTFDVEADPTDFLLGGYRLHAGFIHDPFRYDIGILKVEIPRALHGNDRFEYRISGVVARIDYLFASYPKWFLGLEGTQMENTYTHIPSGESEKRHPFLLAARTGYRFVFFGHLTITPWIGMGVLLNKGDDYVIAEGDRFKVPTFNVFPTVHVGWAF